jgi:hypothetical protein
MKNILRRLLGPWDPTSLPGRLFMRSSLANVMMVLFIVLTSIGTVLISPPVGLIVAGVTCGIYGYLLGSE